jgi:hypothetical protein
LRLSPLFFAASVSSHRLGERPRPRVLFPAPSPETLCVRGARLHPNVFGEGAKDNTRGRVCSPHF